MFFYCHVAGKRKLFHIYQKQTVIFIVVEDMIQFCGSDIECFECLKSRESNILRRQSRTGNYSVINGLVCITRYLYYVVNKHLLVIPTPLINYLET